MGWSKKRQAKKSSEINDMPVKHMCMPSSSGLARDKAPATFCAVHNRIAAKPLWRLAGTVAAPSVKPARPAMIPPMTPGHSKKPR